MKDVFGSSRYKMILFWRTCISTKKKVGYNIVILVSILIFFFFFLVPYFIVRFLHRDYTHIQVCNYECTFIIYLIIYMILIVSAYFQLSQAVIISNNILDFSNK